MHAKFEELMARKPQVNWGLLVATTIMVLILGVFLFMFLTPREHRHVHRSHPVQQGTEEQPASDRQPEAGATTGQHKLTISPAKPSEATSAATSGKAELTLHTFELRKQTPPRWPWVVLALVVAALVAGGYRLVRKLRLSPRLALLREHRYIRQNAERLASRDEFSQVKTAWENLLAFYGFAKQPQESLSHQADRAARTFGFAASTLRQFAQACDAETYGNVQLTREFRRAAIRHYLELYDIFPEAVRSLREK